MWRRGQGRASQLEPKGLRKSTVVSQGCRVGLRKKKQPKVRTPRTVHSFVHVLARGSGEWDKGAAERAIRTEGATNLVGKLAAELAASDTGVPELPYVEPTLKARLATDARTTSIVSALATDDETPPGANAFWDPRTHRVVVEVDVHGRSHARWTVRADIDDRRGEIADLVVESARS